ncbi:hypothetical protein ACFL4K_00955 [Candidatus Neomarinimicrobiota bacterium]
MDVMKIVSIVLTTVLSLAVGIALVLVSYEQLGFYTAFFYALLAVAFIWLSHLMWRWMYRSGYKRGYQQGLKNWREGQQAEAE